MVKFIRMKEVIMSGNVKKIIITLLVCLMAGLAFAQEGWNVNLVSEFTHNWYDGVVDVDYQAPFFYLACGHDGFRIVGNPNALDPGLSDFGHYSCNQALVVDVVGDYAYIGNENDGLHIVNIADPYNPVLSQHIPMLNANFNTIRVYGQYLFTCCTIGGLSIFDISEPGAVTAVWSSTDITVANDVAFKNDTMYMACHGGNMRIYSIADIDSPMLVNTYNVGNSELIHGVAVSGNYAYLADGELGFVVVDLTTLQQVASIDSLSFAFRVETQGDYAYMSYGSPECPLAVIDISNPTAPVVTGIYDPPEDLVHFQVNGSQVYTADNYHGLRIINVADPYNPYESFVYNRFGRDYDIKIQGDFAYLHENYKLEAFNISDPANPVAADYYELDQEYSDFAILGNTAYVSQPSEMPLQVVDISNADNFHFIGGITYDREQSSYGVAVIGQDTRYACVPGYSDVKIFDVTNPQNIQQVGYYAREMTNTKIISCGNYVFMQDHDKRLCALDLSDPTNPAMAGQWPLQEFCRDMKVVNNWLYVVSNQKFWIFNLDSFTPWAPTAQLTLLNHQYRSLRGVDVKGDYAYIVGDSIGLLVYDISNRSLPQCIGYSRDIDYPQGVAVKDNFIIVANFYNLVIFECPAISDIHESESPSPKAIELLASYPNPFNSATQISFAIPREGHVMMTVYDILGRVITTLADREFEAGKHTIRWDGNCADGNPAVSGRYYVRVTSDGDCLTIPVTLLK
jgi:hypothetical protein